MRYNLFLGILWLCAGSCLLGAHVMGKEIAGMPPDRELLIAVVVLVLAAWNFARWWAARVRQKARNAAKPPPRKRAVEKPPAEYHPEFDFTQPDPPAS